MKKNRPGTLLTVIAPPEQRSQMADVIFRETTTIGLRHYDVERECLAREIVDGRDPARRRPLQDRAPRRPHRQRDARSSTTARQLAAASRPVGEGDVAGTHRPCTSALATLSVKPILPDHRHRLRQQPAAPRHGLREGLRRRHRPLQAPGRLRHPLPDGQRRALAERLQAGASKQGLDPLAYCDQMEQEFRAAWRRARRLVRRLHPDDRSRATRRRAATSSSASSTPATSTRASTRAGTASAARSSSRRRISSTATARCTRR